MANSFRKLHWEPCEVEIATRFDHDLVKPLTFPDTPNCWQRGGVDWRVALLCETLPPECCWQIIHSGPQGASDGGRESV